MIHRYWTGPDLRPPMTPWVTNVIHSTQGEMPHDWTDENLPQEILRAADAAHSPRARANIVRVHLLWHYGGLWLDHDVIPLVKLVDPHDQVPLMAWHHGGSLCPSVMRFQPEHEGISKAMFILAFDPDRPLAGIMDEVYQEHHIERLALPIEPTGEVHPWVAATIIQVGQ